MKLFDTMFVIGGLLGLCGVVDIVFLGEQEKTRVPTYMLAVGFIMVLAAYLFVRGL